MVSRANILCKTRRFSRIQKGEQVPSEAEKTPTHLLVCCKGLLIVPQLFPQVGSFRRWGMEGGGGSRHTLHHWQHRTSVTVAWGMAQLCMGISTTAHSCPAAPALPTMTSASLSKKETWTRQNKYCHTSHWEKNLETNEWHLKCSPCLVTPSPSPWPCHRKAL